MNWPARAVEYPYALALFGRFEARSNAGIWTQMESGRLQRILAYLLLYRERPHHREVLASTLWPGSSPQQSRKNLRQNLWHLQRIASANQQGRALPVLAEKDWVQANSSQVWLDVAVLDEAVDRVRAVPPERLSDGDAAGAMEAVALYRGDLLEGWDERWCVDERERLKSAYLALLEKLVGYCEASNRWDQGLAYGDQLLRHDPAHERAHWRVMRIHHLAGDRTGALRQFEKCRNALDQELGVGPGHLTRALYEEICSSG